MGQRLKLEKAFKGQVEISNLCHAVGGLQAGVAAMNINLLEMNKTLLDLHKRTRHVERQFSFYRGGFAVVMAIGAMASTLASPLIGIISGKA